MNQERERIFAACTRFLNGHYRQTPQQILSKLAAITDSELQADRYGAGELITSFEEEIATILGKEAAVFMPSGTMCQLIALRIWTDRCKVPVVAFHPTCHLELHEQQAYKRLHNLSSVLVGSPDRLITLSDLQTIAEPLGALLLELPQREIGGQLPTWDELTEIIAWAQERALPVHLDGARLWECRPFYGRPYAEIAALFDTVYVSFYKILDGIAGAVLAGPADVIAEARIWQRRYGGNLIRLYPYVLAAKNGLAKHLERIDAYCAKAREIAAVLSTFPQIEVIPNVPSTNMMHVFLHGQRDRLEAAAVDIARESHTLLFTSLVPTLLPTYHKFELVVGDASLDLSNEEIAAFFQTLFARAEADEYAKE